MTALDTATQTYVDTLLAPKPDIPSLSPLAGYDEFNGAALDTGGTRFASARSWAWRNQGSATLTLSGGRLVMVVPSAVGTNLRIIEQAAPAGSFKFYAKMLANFASANFVEFGIILTNTVNGKMIGLNGGYNGGRGNCFATKYTSVTVSAGNFMGPNADMPARFGGYWGLGTDGTNINCYASDFGDPDSYYRVATTLISSDLNGAPTHIGIYGNNNSGSDLRICCDWFRPNA